MLKIYRFSKMYWLVLLVLFFISILILVYFFYFVKLNDKIPIKVEIDNHKKISFNINSDLFYKIKKDSYVLLTYKKQDFALKIKNIQHISDDVFNVALSFNSKLKFLQPKTNYNAILVLKQLNSFAYLFS